MRRARLTPDVVDNHVVARRAHVERHARTHGPKTNETHSHICLLSVLSVGLNLYLFLVAENTVSVMCKGFRNKKPRPLFVSLIERRPCCAITAGGLNGRVNLLTTNNKRLAPIARFNNDCFA